MSDTVLSELSNGVRLITLNRPAVLNAMNAELVGALADAFEAANVDPETRVIIFTGAGKAFCAGADLKEMAENADYIAWAGHPDGPTHVPLSKPVIAAIESSFKSVS